MARTDQSKCGDGPREGKEPEVTTHYDSEDEVKSGWIAGRDVKVAVPEYNENEFVSYEENGKPRRCQVQSRELVGAEYRYKIKILPSNRIVENVPENKLDAA